MDIRYLSSIVARLGIKIPETSYKEEIIRFLTETKSERIVELPLIISSIPNNKKLNILDVGCRYSILSIHLASLGHHVVGVDINDYHYQHPNFTFKKIDIRNSGLKKNTFDIIISLSTLEHIGLGRYGDKIDDRGDQEVVKEISKILKPSGQFIFTVPFGKACTTPWYRVYDIQRIEELLSENHLKSELKFYHEKNKGIWIPATLKEATKIDSSIYAKAIAFIVAVKK